MHVHCICSSFAFAVAGVVILVLGVCHAICSEKKYKKWNKENIHKKTLNRTSGGRRAFGSITFNFIKEKLCLCVGIAQMTTGASCCCCSWCCCCSCNCCCRHMLLTCMLPRFAVCFTVIVGVCICEHRWSFPFSNEIEIVTITFIYVSQLVSCPLHFWSRCCRSAFVGFPTSRIAEACLWVSVQHLNLFDVAYSFERPRTSMARVIIIEDEEDS